MATTGFSFGSTATAGVAAPSSNLFAPKATGTVAPSPGGTGFSFPAPAGIVAATTKPSLTLNLNQPTALPTTSSTLLPGAGGGVTFNFPSQTIAAAAPAISTGFTLGGFPSLAQTKPGAGIGFGLSQTSVAPTTAVRGLGGVEITAVSTCSNTTVGGQLGAAKTIESKAVKETTLPNEINQQVLEFQKYVKDQKCVHDLISRMSCKQLFHVQDDVVTFRQQLSVLSNSIHRTSSVVEKLKTESAQELRHVEMAHRMNETPLSLQYDISAPTEYFQSVVNGFHTQMQQYRHQIEQLDTYLSTMTESDPFTPQDLSLVMRKIHETFLALAAQLQIINEAVKLQKEHYLNYRRVFYHEQKDAPHLRTLLPNNPTMKKLMPQSTIGPSPFTDTPSATASAMATALNTSQQPTAPPILRLSNTGGLGTSSLFAPTSVKQPSLFSSFGSPATGSGGLGGFGLGGGLASNTTQPSFNLSTFDASKTPQLAKPPLGSKRNKSK